MTDAVGNPDAPPATPGETLLRRADRAVGQLSLAGATALLTGVAVLAAMLLSALVRLVVFDAVPLLELLAGTALVSAVVALPIVLHSQRLIRALDRRKRELRELTRQLIVARDEAEAGSRAKSAFLANMSHELRTPLNAIIGFSELIKDEAFGPEELGRYRDYARDIHASGQHLLAVINGILDLARIEAGQLDIEEGAVEIAPTVAAATRMVRLQAERRRIALSAQIPGKLPALRGSERMLRQILINLLSNAVKFTPEGGQVSVGVRLGPEGEVEIAVADTGIGMAPEDIPKAFRPFHRIETGAAQKVEGTGLGLPLAKALVEMHGGRIWIDSALGKGTRAVLRFPAERTVAASEQGAA